MSYQPKYSTDFNEILFRSTINHVCYPPKILDKSDMILIGFCNFSKYAKFFSLKKTSRVEEGNP